MRHNATQGAALPPQRRRWGSRPAPGGRVRARGTSAQGEDKAARAALTRASGFALFPAQAAPAAAWQPASALRLHGIERRACAAAGTRLERVRLGWAPCAASGSSGRSAHAERNSGAARAARHRQRQRRGTQAQSASSGGARRAVHGAGALRRSDAHHRGLHCSTVRRAGRRGSAGGCCDARGRTGAGRRAFG